MGMHAHFAGLDFSGARGALSNLWSAVGVERDGRLHILSLRPHAFRPDAADFLRTGWRDTIGVAHDTPLLAGLDFPFGIPRQAADAMGLADQGFSDLNRYLAERSPDEVVAAAPDHRKTPRSCDRFAGGATAMAPLDLRLFKQTVTGARFIHELLAIGGVAVLPQAPHHDAALTLIEVYPSITAKDIGIKAPRKPKAPGEARGRPAALSHYVSFDHPAMEATAVVLEDAWDAVLACLSAFLVRDDLDQAARVGSIAPPLVAAEGWIFRHPGVYGNED